MYLLQKSNKIESFDRRDAGRQPSFHVDYAGAVTSGAVTPVPVKVCAFNITFM